MMHDPYKYFRVEGREILDELGKGMLALEKDRSDGDLLPRLFRLAHTLKGAARVVKQREIADQAHAIEDALCPLREAPATREQVDGMLKLLDAATARVAALAPPPATRATEPRDPVPQAPHDVSSVEPLRSLRADVDDMDALLEGVTEVSVQLASVRRAAGSLERVRHLAELLTDQVVSPRAPGFPSGAAQKRRSIVDELDGLVTAVERDLMVGLEQTGRELDQVREAAQRLRLRPASSMFGSLERAARDAAVTLGKQVSFEARGGDVRLDAQMIGAVQRALVQAVRNAVAHGIETEAQRISAGKAPEGRVAIEVTRRGNRAVFACRDDGAGIDLEGVRRAARRRGALPEDGPDTDALLRLLLQGGISTSVAVTEMSGRGVGLDVVRETAERLGGAATIRTKAREGTVLEIVVPMSLTSLDALVVEAAGQMAAIPLDTVRRTLRLAPTDVMRTAEGDSILVEGKVVPFVPLTRWFRHATEAARGPRAWSAVVVESHGLLAAVGVDRLVGTENVVLRPLPDLTPPDPSVAGASLDSEGNPRMVLDPDGLVARARRVETTTELAPPLRRAILVIDDSLTTRMLEQSILESAGYEVDVATSGEEGFERARGRRYALFLVDVEMPGMDGFTFVERSRADPILREIPAILVTSRASREDRERGVAVGASAYIVKGDFDQTDLLDRIRKLLG